MTDKPTAGRKCDVYMITHIESGKRYIGESVDVKGRWRAHVKIAKSPKTKDHFLIHQAIRKYGKDAFTWEIIETCNSKREAGKREIYWIAFYKCNAARYGDEAGYNLTDGGEGLEGNDTMSEKQRKKISEARKGIPTVIAGKKKVADDDGNILYVLPEEAHLYAHNETPHPNRGRKRVVSETGAVIHVDPSEVHLYDGYGKIPSSNTGRKEVYDAEGKVRHVPAEEAHLYEQYGKPTMTENQRLGKQKLAGRKRVMDKEGQVHYVPPDQAHLYEEIEYVPAKPMSLEAAKALIAEREAEAARRNAVPNGARGKKRVMNAEGQIQYVDASEAHLYEKYGKAPSIRDQKGVVVKKERRKPLMTPEEKEAAHKSQANKVRGRKRVMGSDGKVHMVPAEEAHLYAQYGEPPGRPAKVGKPYTGDKSGKKQISDMADENGEQLWVVPDDPRYGEFLERNRLRRNARVVASYAAKKEKRDASITIEDDQSVLPTKG